jgi:hypothetical protein
MIGMQRVKPKALLVDGRGAARPPWGPAYGARCGYGYGTRLLTAALYADEYLIVQIKGTVG